MIFGSARFFKSFVVNFLSNNISRRCEINEQKIPDESYIEEKIKIQEIESKKRVEEEKIEKLKRKRTREKMGKKMRNKNK